jgi:hypothetical protein
MAEGSCAKSGDDSFTQRSDCRSNRGLGTFASGISPHVAHHRAHSWCTPCRVSGFPLARVLQRGTLHPTGMSRFIAPPGPVPFQSPHLHRFCDVAGASSGTACPRGSLHARIAPLPLLGSMRSETPGARQSLALACTDAWLARRSRRSAGTPSLPFSGLWVRCSASTLHLAKRLLPQQRFRAVGST